MSCASKNPDGTPMMDCGDVMDRLWDYLDGGLDEQTIVAIRAHLDACGHCLPHAEYGEAFLRAVAATGRAGHSAASADVLKAKVLDRLRGEGFSGESAA